MNSLERRLIEIDLILKGLRSDNAQIITAALQRFNQFQIADADNSIGGPGDDNINININGESCQPGISGPPGEPGINGTNGGPGLNGKDGESGAPGLNGTNGEPGINGANGEPGLNGTNGEPGINGKDGISGLNGKDGISGINGANGEPGLNGTNGEPGINGKDGISGLNGANGEPGLNGKDGEPGECVCCSSRLITKDYETIETDNYIGVITPEKSPVKILLCPDPTDCMQLIIKAEMPSPMGNRKITIDGNGYSIDGKIEYVMENPYEWVQLLFRGNTWNIIGRK